MNNQEFFEQYSREPWAVEQNLCFLLLEYAEKLGVKNPYSSVAFVKQFMKEETLVDVEFAEKSAIDRLSKQADIIDADFKEVEEITEKEQVDKVSEFAAELKAHIRDGVVFDLSLDVLIDELVKEYQDDPCVVDLACELKSNINERQIGSAFKQLIDELAVKYIEIERVSEASLTPHTHTHTLFGISEGIICQQVNCCGVMGAGLAKAILEKYPQVKEAFDDYYKHTTNDKNKNYQCHFNQLGSYQLVPLDKPYKSIQELQRDPDYRKDSRLMVANIYSQDFYGNPAKTGKIYTKLDMLINSIKTIAASTDLPVYIPHTKNLEGKGDYGIGCGYGGETWERVYPQLQELAEEYDNLYLLDTKTGEVEKVAPIQEQEREELDMEIGGI